VRERLQAPDLRPGIAGELGKHGTTSEAEIAELGAIAALARRALQGGPTIEDHTTMAPM
jgi:hypothetical protein